MVDGLVARKVLLNYFEPILLDVILQLVQAPHFGLDINTNKILIVVKAPFVLFLIMSLTVSQPVEYFFTIFGCAFEFAVFLNESLYVFGQLILFDKLKSAFAAAMD